MDNQETQPLPWRAEPTADLSEYGKPHVPPTETPSSLSPLQRLTMDDLLQACVMKMASDIYITYGCPPSLRIGDQIVPYRDEPLDDETIHHLLQSIINSEQLDEFESTMELNTSIAFSQRARFRVNIFRQQQHTAMVIRRIQTVIPTIDELGLPNVYKKLSMMKRGLILVVGQTGCGKSTSLAAMIGHRNQNDSGHIITIEDPIEYVHEHGRCIVSQRDVGIDTYSFGMALKNALRQHPDVILIGEIRDRETMEHAINFSETGHLCVATLHANNASQAVERVINFFPEEKHNQILLDLALNLRGILAQRLVPSAKGDRQLAIEILLNEGLITSLIQEGKIRDIRDVMQRSRDRGMQTFDQSLIDLYFAKEITEATALAECDNPATIQLSIKQRETSAMLENTDTPMGRTVTRRPIIKSNENF